MVIPVAWLPAEFVVSMTRSLALAAACALLAFGAAKCAHLDLPEPLRFTFPGFTPTATLIWMHGLGDSGHGWHELGVQLRMPDFEIVLPHGGERPITALGGRLQRSWFDLLSMRSLEREDVAGIQEAAVQMHALMDAAVEQGVPPERLVVGGFSQGAALALAAASTYKHRIGGCIVVGGWLPLASRARELFTPAFRHTPVLLVHGKQDGVIPVLAAHAAHAVLQQHGVRGAVLLGSAQHALTSHTCAGQCLPGGGARHGAWDAWRCAGGGARLSSRLGARRPRRALTEPLDRTGASRVRQCRGHAAGFGRLWGACDRRARKLLEREKGSENFCTMDCSENYVARARPAEKGGVRNFLT